MKTKDVVSGLAFTADFVGKPVVAFFAHDVAYNVAENVYQRPNKYMPIAENLGNPNYLTSFTAPLMLMWVLSSMCQFAEVGSGNLNDHIGEKIFKILRKIIVPVGVVAMNTIYELYQRPAYPDNLGADIAAGIAAGLLYVAWDKLVTDKAVAAIK